MKTLSSFPFARHSLSLAMMLMITSVSAQVAPENPGPEPVPVPAAPAPAAVTDVPAAAPTLGTALLTMKFDRSSGALLAATRSQRKGAPLSEVEKFEMSVMFGDWVAVGKALAELPAETAAAGYTKMLEVLAAQAIPSGMVLRAPEQDNGNEDLNERRMRLQKEKDELATKSGPLLSEDFYALLDASPTDLREENIPALTKLVSNSLGEGGRRTLVEKLKAGRKGLGGTTPVGGILATRLLSSLGWIQDAEPFLPLKQEDWESSDPTQLVFAMEYFTQKGIAERDERQLQRAAELCAWLMKTSRFGNYTRPQFRLAMDRLVQLLPALDAADAQKLIREQLFKQTETLADLISIIGELGQTAAMGKNLQARAANLGTQHLILGALVAKQDELPANVAVLVMNWLTEAEGCYRAGGVAATDISQADLMMMRRYGMGQQAEINSLSTDQILATAPPLELVAKLNPGLVQRVQLTLLKVNILRPDLTDLTLLRNYVKEHPGFEREVCQEVLVGWVSKRTKPAESAQVKQMRAYGMYIPQQMLQVGSGIPLTRLRQNQNIEQFKALLAELREISRDELDPSLIVQAFMTLHSGAEVYRITDIETIFGPPEKMQRKELLELLGGMRARLGQQWRDPKTQQQAGTNRTEEEAKDEVSRGYRTALELAKRGIRAEDGDWKSFITRGQLFFDASQYEFERQVKLTEYVSLRDEGFNSFRTATQLYAAQVPKLPRGQWTIEPYQAWFFVMLGASDLAQLTSTTARTDPGLSAIGDAMRALPSGVADKHLEMFATMLGETFSNVPANIRQRFLNSGLKIVGENHPAARAATKSLDYYRELLDEIQLRITVDGPTRVGHSQPFGAFIGLETTRQLLRESGGFTKYVQNPSAQQNQMAAMQAPATSGSQNHRDDFVKNIHAALDENFEVISINFPDGFTKTIDLARDGWVETPFAYLILRAKNAAVDRIPSIQIDMDFTDQPGRVVLPVLSQVQPLDAKDAAVESRPFGELALTLTMDEREWKEGKVVVEIQARGQGIIPALDDLFTSNHDGFELEIVDSKLSLSEFSCDGKQRIPHTDRNWQLTYLRAKDLRGDILMHFPSLKAGITPSSIEYKHYQDADLMALDATKARAGIMMTSVGSSAARNGGLIGLLLALLAAGIWFTRKKKTNQSIVAEELTAPTDPTPFATVAFLRRIRTSYAPKLSDKDQVALSAQIDEIEAGYFSGAQAPTLDLTAIIGKWQGVARKSS